MIWKLKSSMLLPLLTLISLRLEVNADCNPPPPISNGWIQYPVGENGRRPLKERTMLNFYCKPGFYSSSGDSVVICWGSKWKAIGSGTTKPMSPMRCVAKPCPIIRPKNGEAELQQKKVVYSCNRGFELKGPPHAWCRLNDEGDYYVTASVPQCVVLAKCKRPNLPALKVGGNCCFAGDKVNFSCEDGFKMMGESTLTCRSNGLWSQIVPFCTLIPRCKDPGVGSNVKRFGDCEKFGCKIGTNLVFQCEEGYEQEDMSADNYIECQEDETWSDKIPICKPIGIHTCPAPPEENRLIIDYEITRSHPGLFLPNDTIEFDCQENFQTNSPSLTLNCQSDGTWDEEMPSCIPMDPCSLPDIPKNGRILELENNQQKEFPIGFEINFECDDGYEIRSGKYGTRCIGNKWETSSTVCTPITCSDPGVPNFATVSYSDPGFKIDSYVTYTCMGSRKLIGSKRRFCQKNGRWSGFTAVCDNGDSICLDPGVPINSYRVGDSFNIGDVITYTCKKDYTLIGNGTRVCLKNGYWSGEEVDCMGVNEYSDPNTVMDALDDVLTTAARSAANSEVGVTLERSNGRSIMNIDHGAGVNIFFLLDVSGSILAHQLNQAKGFTKMVIRKIGITADKFGIRAGLITFSSSAKVEFTTTVKSVDAAVYAIDSIKRPEKVGTNLKLAFESLAGLISIDKAHRPKAKSIAFLLSDGMVTEGGTPLSEAQNLKIRLKVDIYAVAVGNKIDDKLLKEISTQYFVFSSHTDLLKTVEAAIGRKIDFGMCGLERPQYSLEPVKDKQKKRSKRSTESVARIIGGKKVLRPWPWMAGLEVDAVEDRASAQDIPKGVLCGAFIINAQWIMSAAHCFTDDSPEFRKVMENPKNWKILIGRTNIEVTSGLEFRIEQLIPHPNFDYATLNYDIALLKLRYPISYDNFMRPVCLPPAYAELIKTNSSLYKAQHHATVTGWGHTTAYSINDSVEAKSVTELNELTIPLTEPEICSRPFSYINCRKGPCRNVTAKPTENMFCAGHGRGGEDSCRGDSGGPLMQQVLSTSGNVTTERWFVIGIVSWGIGCGEAGFYGYYTNIAKMRPWIEKETKVGFESVTI